MPAINVSPLDAELLDAVVRLVRLVDAAAEARVLAPLITREIVVRLLLGAQGGRLRQLAVLGGDPNRIAVAVARLRKDYTRPFRIEDLAHEVGMSVSRFHHHFRAVTALSPLQFQKQLRLQEARRLMLGDGLDADQRGRAGRLRERGALHAGVQTAVWCAADARRSTAADQPQARRSALTGVRWERAPMARRGGPRFGERDPSLVG